MQLHVLQASTDRDLDTVFAALRADALVIGPYFFFGSRMEQIGALSLRHAVPAISMYRPFVVAGGLISYGLCCVDRLSRAPNPDIGDLQDRLGAACCLPASLAY
jgi:hypothetical protein